MQLENLNQVKPGPLQRRSEVAAKAVCAWPEGEALIFVYFVVFSFLFLLLLPCAAGGHEQALLCCNTLLDYSWNRRHNWQAKYNSGCALTNSTVNINTRLFFPYLIYNFWIYVLAVFALLPFTVVLASYTITSLKMTG